MANLSGSNLGGGPYQGYSPVQTLTNSRDSESTMTRRVLRDGWNTNYARGQVNGKNRVTTPFRAVNNSGDFLGRVQYNSGGSNQVNASKPGYKGNIGSLWTNTDGTGVPASTCNTKFVADSSDYVTFKKQQAINRNYNDLSNGGDKNNASYVPLMAVRR